MSASSTASSWERVGELATQLSDCAADLERFLSAEADHLQSLLRQLDGQAERPRRRFHPGSSDPAIAAILSRFEQLEAAAGGA